MSDLLPIVLQLQMDAADLDVPVARLLRVAKMVAVKLDLKDALVWIDLELDGYMTLPLEAAPAYRRLSGEPKGFNHIQGRWLPISFADSPEHQRTISQAPIGMPLPSIESELANKEGFFIFPYSPENKSKIMKALDMPASEIAVHLTRASMQNIVDAVRNLILDWSLQLEKAGILGEKMTFTPKEKKEAGPVTNMAKVLPCTGSNSGDAIQSVAAISRSPLFRCALMILSCFSDGRRSFIWLSPSLDIVSSPSRHL